MIYSIVRYFAGSFIILFLLVVPFFLYAEIDSFTITQEIVNTDIVAPTIPNPVTATPIASTQIDITWGASTDDQNLTGYRLFRDTVQISTTTLTTYSDTGLAASTTYSYTVQAYDWLLNISTTSVAAATTTLQSPSITASSTDKSTVGTRFQLRLFDIDISTNQTSAEIAWETNQYAQYSLRWGKVSSYDLGFVNNDSFRKSHRTVITDLEPGSTYVYELLAYDQRGVEFVLSRGTFTTKKSQDNAAPSNVSNLYATVEGDSVVLNWVNPPDTDFYKVRIVRNYNFYPTDTSNGFIAYEGDLNSFYDANALKLYPGQFYTIFSYDDSGNISSGAVVSAVKIRERQDSQTNRSGNTIVAQPDKIIPRNNGDLLDVNAVDFKDVNIIQNDIRIDPIENVVRVLSSIPVVIEIPYELLSKNLKTILVTIKRIGTPPVSYMLRINKDKSAYQAVLPPLEHLGEYTLMFSVYDYKTQLLTTFGGVLQVEEESTASQLTKQVFKSELMYQPVIFKSFLFLLLLLFIIYFIYIRRRNG